MLVSGLILGVITVLVNVVILIFPKIINYLIGIYLIIIGAIAILQGL